MFITCHNKLKLKVSFTWLRHRPQVQTYEKPNKGLNISAVTIDEILWASIPQQCGVREDEEVKDEGCWKEEDEEEEEWASQPCVPGVKSDEWWDQSSVSSFSLRSHFLCLINHFFFSVNYHFILFWRIQTAGLVQACPSWSVNFTSRPTLRGLLFGF